MRAGTICSRVVATASPEESISVAARRMVRNDVGTLVVVEGGGSNRVVGILTDRDVTTRCIAADLDPHTTPVLAVMSKPVHSIGEDTSVDDALARMTTEGTRRLVVTDRGSRLLGVLSLDDILERTTEEGGALRRLFEKQRPRIPA